MVQSDALNTVVVADKGVINEIVNLPSESAAEADNFNHSSDGPSFNILTPMPDASPEKTNHASGSIDDLSPLTENDVKMCDLVAKLATMTVSGKKLATRLFIDGKCVGDSTILHVEVHPIQLLQDLGDHEMKEEIVDAKGKKPMDPSDGMARRTRSHKTGVTPVSITTVEQKYKRQQLYKMLSDEARYHVSLMAIAQSTKRYENTFTYVSIVSIVSSRV